MSRIALLAAIFLLALGIGSFYLGRSAKSPAPSGVDRACATGSASELQARVDALVAELKDKNARLSDVYETLVKFLLLELGLKLRQEDLAAILRKDAERAEAKKPVAPAPVAAAASRAESGAKAAEPPEERRPFPAEYYKLKGTGAFVVPELFMNKQAAAPSELAPFADLRGRYVGLVTLDDKTEDSLDVDFEPVRDDQGELRSFRISVTMKDSNGHRVVNYPVPTEEVKFLSFGPDDLASVGGMQTGYVIAGFHHFAFAWPTERPAEAAHGRILEGYYFYKRKPSGIPKGRESGSFYLYRR